MVDIKTVKKGDYLTIDNHSGISIETREMGYIGKSFVVDKVVSNYIFLYYPEKQQSRWRYAEHLRYDNTLKDTSIYNLIG